MLRFPTDASPVLTPVDLFRSDVLAKLRDAAAANGSETVPNWEMIRALWDTQTEDVKAPDNTSTRAESVSEYSIVGPVNPPTQKKRKYTKSSGKKERDSDEPKRPANAYLLFRKDVREEVIRNNPGRSSQDLSKIIGQMWRNMSEAEKEVYNDRSKVLRNQYHEDRKAYQSRQHELQMEKNAHAVRAAMAASPESFGTRSSPALSRLPTPQGRHDGHDDFGDMSDSCGSEDDLDDINDGASDRYDVRSLGSGVSVTGSSTTGGLGAGWNRTPSYRPPPPIRGYTGSVGGAGGEVRDGGGGCGGEVTLWVRFGNDPDPVKLMFATDGSKDVHDLKEAALGKCRPGGLGGGNGSGVGGGGGGAGSVTAFVGTTRLEPHRAVDASLLQGVSAVTPLLLVPNIPSSGVSGKVGSEISVLRVELEAVKARLAEMNGVWEGRVGRCMQSVREVMRDVDGFRQDVGQMRQEILGYARHLAGGVGVGSAGVGVGLGVGGVDGLGGAAFQMLDPSTGISNMMDKLNNFQQAMDDHTRTLQTHSGDLHSLQQAFTPPSSTQPGPPSGQIMHLHGRERDR
ncbi:high mobility group box 3 [Rhizophlyctis rosea]|nr:high mobility group box 3 [Rhizophlyctis rosea]